MRKAKEVENNLFHHKGTEQYDWYQDDLVIGAKGLIIVYLIREGIGKSHLRAVTTLRT